MSTRILVVDANAGLHDPANRYLASRGFEISVLRDADFLQDRLRRNRPDLIVLDMMMPGVGGLTTLRNLRAAGDKIPVIILTACVDAEDKVAGLDLGADDYLGKPCNPRELQARIQSVLRRCSRQASVAKPQIQTRMAFGRFALDLRSRTLRHESSSFRLSDREFALLKIFAVAPMRVFTREHLIALMHRCECSAAERGIDVLICRLRRLFETDPSMPRLIQTVHGRGYVSVPDGQLAARLL